MVTLIDSLMNGTQTLPEKFPAVTQWSTTAAGRTKSFNLEWFLQSTRPEEVSCGNIQTNIAGEDQETIAQPSESD